MSKLGGGKLEWLALGDMSPHPKAQRRFKQAWGDQLAATFDPEAVDILTVSRGKRGQNWIVDGAHRHYAALKYVDGDRRQCLLCRVFEDDNDATAAMRFLRGNSRLGVGTLDKYLVSVAAKDATSLSIEAVLRKHDLRVDYTRADGVVQAVAACRWVVTQKRGVLLFEAVIRTLREAWGANPDAYNGYLIKGLALVFIKYWDVLDGDVLARKLAKSGVPVEWVGRARTLAGANRVAVAHGMCECIRNEYNKGRRTERLEEAA